MKFGSTPVLVALGTFWLGRFNGSRLPRRGSTKYASGALPLFLTITWKLYVWKSFSVAPLGRLLVIGRAPKAIVPLNGSVSSSPVTWLSHWSAIVHFPGVGFAWYRSTDLVLTGFPRLSSVTFVE